MAIDARDIGAWAARIRPHFPAPMQDTAEAAAYWLATAIGPQVKDLRPDTRMATVLGWLKVAPRRFSDPDWVELLMAIEAEVSSEISDAFAETIEHRTFREYIGHLVAQRPDRSTRRGK